MVILVDPKRDIRLHGIRTTLCSDRRDETRQEETKENKRGSSAKKIMAHSYISGNRELLLTNDVPAYPRVNRLGVPIWKCGRGRGVCK